MGGGAGRGATGRIPGPAWAGKLKSSGKGGRASPPKGRPAGCFLGNASPEKGAGRGFAGA